MKIAGALGVDALRVLRALPGVDAADEPVAALHERVDAVITVADRELPVAVESRGEVNAGAARQLIHVAEQLGDLPLLVVAGQTTSEARHLLRERGVGVVDGRGHAHLELPGLLIHVEGDARAEHGGAPKPRARLSGKAGVTAQALLMEHERAWKVTELAAQAEVSVGLAHRVLTRLADEGIMNVEGAGPSRVRHLTDPAALLDLWAEEQHGQRRRTHAYLLAQTPRQAIEQLGANLDASGVAYALTGAAGASVVAPFVSALPVANVWVAATETSERLCAAAQAEPVASGHNVAFLQGGDDAALAFRQRVEDRWVVNPFRLYVDLRQDPQRGREQAEHLRQEVIGF